MTKITREFENAGNFTIDEVRYDAIVEMCTELDSNISADWVDSVLFYDWDNADEHQEYLNENTIEDISDWVVELASSWQ